MQVIADNLTGNTGITGRITFSDNPISDYTSDKPVIEFFNLSARKKIINAALYDDNNAEITLKNTPYGKYQVSVKIRSAKPNALMIPGNYFDEFSFDENNLNPLITLKKVIHLTKPEDTNRPLENFEDVCHNQRVFKNPVYFNWEPIGKNLGNIHYEYQIIRLNCSRLYQNIAQEGRTDQTALTLNLIPNLKNEFYLLKIYAKEDNGKMIGTVGVPGSSGRFWTSYQFRVTE
ncbi:MAG: hypothetical protein PHE84_10055 [bacterium]|nr:hypothetical protein [bacterium]